MLFKKVRAIWFEDVVKWNGIVDKDLTVLASLSPGHQAKHD